MPKPKPKNKRLIPVNEVRLGEAKPNPLFPDWLTERLRFLTYAEPIACRACGSMRKHHWTLFMTFTISDWPGPKDNQFRVAEGKTTYSPLTPVCRKHFLAPKFK